MSLDLSKGRVLAFSVGKRAFTLTLKPIDAKAWLKYFAAIDNTQELVDGEVVSTYDSSGARLELLEAHLIDATGYTAEGVSIQDQEGWQAKLPMAHRRAAADLLVDCEVVKPFDTADLPPLGTETVILAATWSADDGKMQKITGLLHTFRSPSAEHQKRYSRAISSSVVTGGRQGKTHFRGAQAVLIEIYDELITAIVGYNWNDQTLNPLGMDAYHKVVATQALFTPVEI